MIWTIAWRNIWRNKLRSVIVITALAIGLFAGVFSMGLYQGMAEMRYTSAIKTEVSHIQIFNKTFRENYDIQFSINNSNKIVEKINNIPKVAASSRRLLSECIVSSAHGTSGIKLIGIEPNREKKVTDISEKIIDGNYFEYTSSRIPTIVIGKKLAQKLKLNIGSKLPVQMLDIKGDISYKLYKVRGIYESVDTSYEEMNAFVMYAEMQHQLAIDGDIAHQIVLFLKPDIEASEVASALKKEFPTLEILTWKEINKELALLADSMNQYMYIFVLIIMLALCFGIVNTMLMAVLERTRELGMLMAVGMNQLRIFLMIILESVFLCITGGIVGIIIGWVVIKNYETKPLILDIFKGFETYGYSYKIYTKLLFSDILIIGSFVILLGVISAIYPAKKATQLDPAEAIRTI